VKWVLAMEVYERVNKVVVPKKVKLKEAEAELAEQMGKLRLKQAELQEVVDKLTAMENEYEAKKAKKKELEDNINLCKLKLERAEKLLSGENTLYLDTKNHAKDLFNQPDSKTRVSIGNWWVHFFLVDPYLIFSLLFISFKAVVTDGIETSIYGS